MTDNLLDTYCQDYITCPYCGDINYDSWEYSDMINGCDYECPSCGNVCFLDEPVRSIKYTTVKK